MSNRVRDVIEATLDDLFQFGTRMTLSDISARIRSALDAAGFAVVPKEPPAATLKAAMQQIIEDHAGDIDFMVFDAASIWTALLLAAHSEES